MALADHKAPSAGQPSNSGQAGRDAEVCVLAGVLTGWDSSHGEIQAAASKHRTRGVGGSAGVVVAAGKQERRADLAGGWETAEGGFARA